MNEIIGSFFFRLEGGNLMGEYTNTSMNRALPENATRIQNANENNAQRFVGNFNSTWGEISNGRETSILSIELLPGSVNKFMLIWHENGKILFRGEGFLVEPNLMVGHYTN